MRQLYACTMIRSRSQLPLEPAMNCRNERALRGTNEIPGISKDLDFKHICIIKTTKGPRTGGMGKTLSSALILSTIGLGSKAVIKLLARRFDVRGLPTLLNALREPDLELSWRKGKEKASKDDESEKPRRRRGIVTSKSTLLIP